MKSKGPDVHTSCPGSASGFEGSEIRLEFYRVAPSHSLRGHCFDRFGGIRQILSFPRMAMKSERLPKGTGWDQSALTASYAESSSTSGASSPRSRIFRAGEPT